MHIKYAYIPCHCRTMHITKNSCGFYIYKVLQEVHDDMEVHFTIEKSTYNVCIRCRIVFNFHKNISFPFERQYNAQSVIYIRMQFLFLQ